MIAPDDLDPRFVGALDLLRACGATEIQVRFSDDEKPIVWFVAARFARGDEVAAGFDPVMAVLRLCEAIVDGGTCSTCRRSTGFLPDEEPDAAIASGMGALMCLRTWRRSTGTFVRGCDGQRVGVPGDPDGPPVDPSAGP